VTGVGHQHRGVAVDEDQRTEVDTVDEERRQAPRFRVTLDARWRRLGRGDDEVDSATVDVSHGGARISAPAQISIGDVIQLTVQMPHGIELTLQGLVVQLSDTDAGHQAHVAFDSLSSAAADLLTELLDEHSDQQIETEADAST
jgi:hypothetical protein